MCFQFHFVKTWYAVVIIRRRKESNINLFVRFRIRSTTFKFKRLNFKWTIRTYHWYNNNLQYFRIWNEQVFILSIFLFTIRTNRYLLIVHPQIRTFGKFDKDISDFCVHPDNSYTLNAEWKRHSPVAIQIFSMSIKLLLYNICMNAARDGRLNWRIKSKCLFDEVSSQQKLSIPKVHSWKRNSN